jgi:hypothetical protein
MDRARRVAVVTLVVVLAVAALVAALPASLVAVRVGGVALVWWSWALVGLVAGIAGLAAVLARDRASEGETPGGGGLWRWASPALMVSIGGLVFSGAPSAPLVATAAVAAPLLGSLLSGPAARGPAFLERLAVPVATGLVLAAQLLVAGEFALGLGVPRGVGIAPAVVLLLATWPDGRRLALRHLPAAAGVLALALGVGSLWAQSATAPWTAWTLVASRPLMAFPDQAPAVTGGIRVRTPSSLVFADAQQVTAVTAGVYRVVERDGDRPMMREWRLAAGESLAVRTGDELVLAADTRVRFEGGKRVPGAPASGVAWAEARPPSPVAALGTFLGAVLTLVGLGTGATAGMRDRAGQLLALAGGIVLVAGAAGWGVYAALAGADLALGTPVTGAFIEAASVLAPGAGGVPTLLLLIACAGWLVGLAPGLRAEVARVVTADGRPAAGGGLAWTVMVAAAAVVAMLEPFGAWRSLGLGAGLLASVLVAPRLLGGPRARLVAGLVGGVSFAAIALASALGRPESVVEYPALVAVPLAWASGWLVDRPES